MPTREARGILAYCHIPKTGGQTIIHILRRNFGARHVDVQHGPSYLYPYYGATELAADLRVYPWAVSLHGHGLQPWIDYGAVGDRLLWYTMLRNPVRRLISAYQFSREVMGSDRTFQAYLARFPTLNFAHRYLTGGDHASAARMLLGERFAAVGLIEHFDASLLIFRDALAVPRLDVRYARPSNTARSVDLRRRIEDEAEAMRDELLERTALDRELLEWVRNDLWPAQLRRYGEARLARDLASQFSAPSAARELNVGVALAYRNLVYKPVIRLAGSRRTGAPAARTTRASSRTGRTGRN